MASTKAPIGTVFNKDNVKDKKSGQVAASTTLAVGLVYQDGSNGWKNAPTDGSVAGKDLYWNPAAIDNSAGSKGDKTGTFYGNGAIVVGKSDGVIVVNQWCKPSTNFANGFITLTDPSATVGATYGSGTTVGAEINEITTWVLARCARYLCHVLEYNNVSALPTSSADTETDCVFQITRA
jgi:hypothetical protein